VLVCWFILVAELIKKKHMPWHLKEFGNGITKSKRYKKRKFHCRGRKYELLEQKGSFELQGFALSRGT